MGTIDALSGNTAQKAASTNNSKTSAVETKTNKPKEESAYIKESAANEKRVTYSKPDMSKINSLRAAQNKNMNAFKAMVEKLLTKQGQLASFNGIDLSSEKGMLRLKSLIEGGMPVDQETIDTARAAIAEDGEFGVEKTSERLFQFAVAASGGDKANMEKMRAAIEKGFAQAKSAWGGDLPEICNKTYEATMKKLDEWSKSQE